LKTLITIAALTLVFASISKAQDTDNRTKLQVGVKAGLSYSNVFDTEGESFNADAKIGLTGGGFLIIPVGKYLGIHPEVMFTQKGFKGTGSLLGSSYEFERTTTFLDIPILVALKPSEFITLLAGPQFSYLLRDKYSFTSSATSFEQEQEFKNDNIRKNILGFVIGANINLRHIVIGGRIGWDMINNKGDGTSSTPRYRNVCTQVTLGYKLY